MDPHRAANRANWDDRVPIHAGSREYDVAGFLADPHKLSQVVAYDSLRLGDVRGKSLLHLQCHFGLDTLSWARLGARVTGIDFSEHAIARARQLADECGLSARFECCNVYDAAEIRGIVGSDLESFGLSPDALDAGLENLEGKVWSARFGGRKRG